MRRPNSSAVFIESLEERRLLAGNAALEGNELVITGTAGDDRIFLSLSAPNSTQLDVKINNKVTSFDLAAIREIKIYGLAGNDHVELFETNGVIPKQTKMFGGGGSDTLVGGAGIDRVHGDDGNDLITTAGNRDHLYGDGGDDSLFGGKGNDSIDGGSGYDSVSCDKANWFEQLFGYHNDNAQAPWNAPNAPVVNPPPIGDQ